MSSNWMDSPTHSVLEMMAVSRYVHFVRLFDFMSFFHFVAPIL